MSATLSAGFADPVRDAQHCFRALLDAMARPGRVHAVPELAPPAPLCNAAAAALLTLVDHETPLWLDPAAGAARGWIEFHCGAPIVTDPARASFVLALAMPDLTALNAGTHEMPESSATVILTVASLDAGTRYRLSGPGLRQPAIFSTTGLPDGFVAAWRDNHARFPRGVDLLLCAGSRLAALPRTTMIEQS